MKTLITFLESADPWSLAAEVATSAVGKAASGAALGMLSILALAALLVLAFWIVMFVAAVRKQYENKAIWIVLLLIGGWVAAIAFYFAVYRDLKKK